MCSGLAPHRPGAALFALTNAFSTALYRNGGATVVSLYIIRSLVVYVINGLLVAWNDGRAEAANVLMLRCGSAEAMRLTLARSLLNATKACLLSISFARGRMPMLSLYLKASARSARWSWRGLCLAPASSSRCTS